MKPYNAVTVCSSHEWVHGDVATRQRPSRAAATHWTAKIRVGLCLILHNQVMHSLMRRRLHIEELIQSSEGGSSVSTLVLVAC